MQKLRLFTLCFFTLTIVQGQTINEKISQLIEVDGTLAKIEFALSDLLDSYRTEHSGVSESYWTHVKENVSEKSIEEFKSILLPIYSKYLSEEELDDAIAFYLSDEGKVFTENLAKIEDELSIEILQWSENVGALIIEEIRKKDEATSTEEYDVFFKELKEKHGLQILNIKDFTIDKEYNVGSLLLDFGEIEGTENITKILKIKNNSPQPVSFNDNMFYNDDVILDWGNKPIEVGETRDIKITLDAGKAEGKRYSSASLFTDSGQRIGFGVSYDAPKKKLKFKTSSSNLKVNKMANGYSRPYSFSITNTGKKEFHISKVSVDKPICYVHYDQRVLKYNETIEFSVVVSKDLMKKHEIKDQNLEINVSISEGDAIGKHFYMDKETIVFTIEE